MDILNVVYFLRLLQRELMITILDMDPMHRHNMIPDLAKQNHYGLTVDVNGLTVDIKNL
jgi:hypothetical protein